MNKAKTLVASLLAGAAVVSVNAFAIGPDFSSILTGLDSSTAITALVGAGVILAGVGFAKWATKKVARFFG
ncbi:hypothetical protein [Rhodanobacter soli]|uniref:Methyltransferase n=1 Tax=Rhodanobacter soli TaxID=590609 RepID=A0ABV2PS14_9GAMM